jgi:NADH-quinone oxidoreductase subunit H
MLYGAVSNVFMFHVIVSMKSKYATLAALRALLVSTYLEVFFTLCLLFLGVHAGTLGLSDIATLTQTAPLLTSLPPLALFLLLYALFESKRAPFDHTEAESELVAGHLVEFGGRVLLFFYLAEYIHVFFCVFLVYLFVTAGLVSGLFDFGVLSLFDAVGFSLVF